MRCNLEDVVGFEFRTKPWWSQQCISIIPFTSGLHLKAEERLHTKGLVGAPAKGLIGALARAKMEIRLICSLFSSTLLGQNFDFDKK